MGTRYTRQLLSPDMKVACRIYELTKIKKMKDVTLDVIEKTMRIHRPTLKKLIQQLIDWGTVRPGFVIRKTKMIRIYEIDPVVYEPIKHLYHDFYKIKDKTV